MYVIQVTWALFTTQANPCIGSLVEGTSTKGFDPGGVYMHLLNTPTLQAHGQLVLHTYMYIEIVLIINIYLKGVKNIQINITSLQLTWFFPSQMSKLA